MRGSLSEREQAVMNIEVKRDLGASPAEMFATMADLESWPEIVRSVLNVELLMDGPVG